MNSEWMDFWSYRDDRLVMNRTHRAGVYSGALIIGPGLAPFASMKTWDRELVKSEIQSQLAKLLDAHFLDPVFFFSQSANGTLLLQIEAKARGQYETYVVLPLLRRFVVPGPIENGEISMPISSRAGEHTREETKPEIEPIKPIIPELPKTKLDHLKAEVLKRIQNKGAVS